MPGGCGGGRAGCGGRAELSFPLVVFPEEGRRCGALMRQLPGDKTMTTQHKEAFTGRWALAGSSGDTGFVVFCPSPRHLGALGSNPIRLTVTQLVGRFLCLDPSEVMSAVRFASRIGVSSVGLACTVLPTPVNAWTGRLLFSPLHGLSQETSTSLPFAGQRELVSWFPGQGPGSAAWRAGSIFFPRGEE